MGELMFFRVNNTKNQGSVLRGLVTWFPNRYTVKVLDESAAYEGEVMFDVMSQYRQTFNVSVEEYMEECKSAFKTDSEPSFYSFSIEEDQLNIRKLFDKAQSNLRVILSSVRLKPVDFSSTVIELLDVALKCNRDYSQTIDTLSHKTASLRTDNQKMATLLEEMEKEKRQFENIIYHKFVNLLNSKKEFYNKEKNVAVKGESEDLLHASHTENVIQDAIFDADTDSDEVSDTNSFSYHKDQPGPSVVCPVSTNESTKSPLITSDSSPQKPSSVESVLSSFAFMDPSVSFLNK